MFFLMGVDGVVVAFDGGRWSCCGFWWGLMELSARNDPCVGESCAPSSDDTGGGKAMADLVETRACSRSFEEDMWALAWFGDLRAKLIHKGWVSSSAHAL